MIIIIVILPECDFNLDSEGDHGTYGWPFRMGEALRKVKAGECTVLSSS